MTTAETAPKVKNNLMTYFQAMNNWMQALPPQSRRVPLKRLKTSGQDLDLKGLKSLLLNAWSAEYALRITPIVNDEQYLQNSLHWTFPQAYYSTVFTARAFLLLTGESQSNEALVSRRIGQYVAKGYYPASLGFYGLGGPEPEVHRLPQVDLPEQDTITTEQQIYLTMHEFIGKTRKQELRRYVRGLQMNPKTALRHSVTDAILVKLTKADYKAASGRLGYTSFMDLLCRLRISSTNRELEEIPALGGMDVRRFHQHLTAIVQHINQVHETYIARAIGEEAYRQLVASLPSYLLENFVRERMATILEETTIA